MKFITVVMLFKLVAVALLTDYASASSPQVFITIDSNATVKFIHKIIENRIQVNWYNASPEIGDWLGLFTQDPVTSPTTTPVFKTLVKSQSGMVDANVSLPNSFADDLPPKKQCLGFWVAYIRRNLILTTNCFKTQPFWMWESRDFIGKMSLSKLMVPGTHDAGSFQPFKGWESENPITEYLITQNYNFWNQLVFGIRHFDIRIAYYKDTDSYWLVHSLFPVNQFEKQLQSIKNFVANSMEIVILDFHCFDYGFVDTFDKPIYTRHDAFVSLLIQELGSFLIPRNFTHNVTLEKLWKTNKRILLDYNLGDYYKTNPYLWPGVHQVWADSDNVTKMVQYFENFMSKPINYSLWSLQAAATPPVIDWFIKPTEGLREKSDEVNPVITKCVRDLWWEKVNIIATDFFEGNNLIEVCIESNKKRAWD